MFQGKFNNRANTIKVCKCMTYLSNVQVDIFTDNKALTYLHTM